MIGRGCRSGEIPFCRHSETVRDFVHVLPALEQIAALIDADKVKSARSSEVAVTPVEAQ